MEQSTNFVNIKERNDIELQKKILLAVMAYKLLSLYDEVYHTNKIEEFMQKVNDKIQHEFKKE